MNVAFALLITLHGLLHLLGASKAFGWADLAELRHPIPLWMGLLWLAAALLLVLGGALWGTRAAGAWGVTLTGVVLSQLLVFTAWGDARAGTLANLAILILLLVAYAAQHPGRLSARYRTEVDEARGREWAGISEIGGVTPGSSLGAGVWAKGDSPSGLKVAASSVALVTSRDLSRLPEPAARWLEGVGVVGRPRIEGFQARFQAAIRGEARHRFMTGVAEQQSFLGPPRRLFLMRLQRAGIPIEVFHDFGPGGARMEARLLGLLPLMEVSGPEMAVSESVTFLNDLALLAPAGLLELELDWVARSNGQVGIQWEHRGHRVAAELRFDHSGALADFESDDRLLHRASGFEPARWRTPILSYRRTPEGLTLPREAQAWWQTKTEAWCYAQLIVQDVGLQPRRPL